MTLSDYKEKTKAFLQDYVDTDGLEDDKDLFASGMVNSLFAMQLVMFVEKTFGVKVENEDLDVDNFRSLNAIAGFIEKKTD